MFINLSTLYRQLALLLSALLILESAPRPATAASVWADRHLMPVALPAPALTHKTDIPNWVLSAAGTDARVSLSSPASSSPTTVLLIHDIHLNSAAQAAIAKVISRLAESAPMTRLAVGLEATAAPSINLSVLAHPTRPKAAKQIVDALLRANVLTGAECAAIHDVTSQTPRISLFGIDSAAAYQNNVQSLRDGWSRRSVVSDELNQFDEKLNRASQQMSTDAQQLDHTLVDYWAGNTKLPAHLQQLSAKAGRSAIGERLRLVLDASDAESRMDIGAAQNERLSLFHTLPYKTANELLAKAQAVKNNGLSASAFYRDLINAAKNADIPSTSFSALAAYSRYLDVIEKIDPALTIEQLPAAQAAALAAIHPTPYETMIFDLRNDLMLLRHLSDHSLTDLEWNRLEQRWLQMQQLPERFGAIGFPISESLWAHGELMSPYLDFYRYASQRDQHMAVCFLDRLASSGMQTGVMVAGGFHARGIGVILRSAGVRVIDIVPSISVETTDHNSPSTLEYLATQRRPIDALVVGERLFLNLPPVTAGPEQKDIHDIIEAGSTTWETGRGTTSGDVTVEKTENQPSEGLELDLPADNSATPDRLVATKKTRHEKFWIVLLLASIPFLLGNALPKPSAVMAFMTMAAWLGGAYMIGSNRAYRTVFQNEAASKPELKIWQEPGSQSDDADAELQIIPFRKAVPWQNYSQQTFQKSGSSLKEFAQIYTDVLYIKQQWHVLENDLQRKEEMKDEFLASETSLYAWLMAIAMVVHSDPEYAEFLFSRLRLDDAHQIFADLTLQDPNDFTATEKNLLVRTPEERKVWFQHVKDEAHNLLFQSEKLQFNHLIPTTSNVHGLSDELRIAIFALAHETAEPNDILKYPTELQASFVDSSLHKWRVKFEYRPQLRPKTKRKPNVYLSVAEILQLKHYRGELKAIATGHETLSSENTNRPNEPTQLELIMSLVSQQIALASLGVQELVLRDVMNSLLGMLIKSSDEVRLLHFPNVRAAMLHKLGDLMTRPDNGGASIWDWAKKIPNHSKARQLAQNAYNEISSDSTPSTLVDGLFDRSIFNYRDNTPSKGSSASSTLRFIAENHPQEISSSAGDIAIREEESSSQDTPIGKLPILWIFDQGDNGFFDLTAQAARYSKSQATYKLYTLQTKAELQQGLRTYSKYLKENRVSGPAIEYARVLERDMKAGRVKFVTADNFAPPVKNVDGTWTVDANLIRRYQHDFERTVQTRAGRIALISNTRKLAGPAGFSGAIIDILLSKNELTRISDVVQIERRIVRWIGSQA